MKELFETEQVIVWESPDLDIFQKKVKELDVEKKELRSKLLQALTDGKYILFEFTSENDKAWAEWVSQMHRFGAMNRLSFLLATAFSNKINIPNHMRPIYNGIFGEAGSMVEFFDSNETTFLEAVKAYDKELQEIDKARVKRQTRESRRQRSRATVR